MATLIPQQIPGQAAAALSPEQVSALNAFLKQAFGIDVPPGDGVVIALSSSGGGVSCTSDPATIGNIDRLYKHLLECRQEGETVIAGMIERTLVDSASDDPDFDRPI